MCRRSGIVGRLEVARHHSGELTRALTAVFNQPGGGLGMVLRAVVLQHALVDHVPQQSMSERVFCRACKRRCLAPEDHLLSSK